MFLRIGGIRFETTMSTQSSQITWSPAGWCISEITFPSTFSGRTYSVVSLPTTQMGFLQAPLAQNSFKETFILLWQTPQDNEEIFGDFWIWTFIINCSEQTIIFALCCYVTESANNSFSLSCELRFLFLKCPLLTPWRNHLIFVPTFGRCFWNSLWTPVWYRICQPAPHSAQVWMSTLRALGFMVNSFRQK